MPWTYNADLTEAKDQVRFLISDTQTARQLIQDEEIEWLLTQEMNVYMAAAACCDVLGALKGLIRAKKIGDLSITYDHRIYSALGTRLRSRGLTYQTPYCGGISVSDKLANQTDTDVVAPAFSKNLDNNPEAPSPATPPVNPLTRF